MGKSIFKFLSSLKLAVLVILSLATVLATGTVFESLYGIAVARERVYGTWWFTLVLFFLGVNVLCGALSRIPWKRHHIGFVVTHAGIITILIGAVITQQWGVDGTLALAEGADSNQVLLDDPLLQIVLPETKSVETWGARFSLKPPREENPWSKTLKNGSELRVDRYLNHSQPSVNVSNEAAAANPAVSVVLSGLPMGADQELSQWLFLKDSELSSHSVQIGPARLSFIDAAQLKALAVGTPKVSKDRIGILKLEGKDGLRADMAVQQELGEMPIPGSAYRLKLLQYLPNARIVDNRLVPGSGEPKNPALEFKILGKDGEEKTRVAFANFPDLAGMHGGQPGKDGVTAEFIPEVSPSELLQPELLLAWEEPQRLLYRIRSHGKLSDIKAAAIGEELPTGWMNIRFKVAEYLPRAQAKVAYRKVPVPKDKSGPPPAIHFTLRNAGQGVEGWLQQGEAKEISLGASPYTLRYGLRAKPLDFRIKLKKFELGRYAGTNNPSSYASEVEVRNEKTGESFASRISMNEPLDYRGYKFYQSSYEEGKDGAPTFSIFSVGKDPGMPVKYAGSILLVSGIALMFWLKPLFVQKRLAAKRQEKMEALVI